MLSGKAPRTSLAWCRTAPLALLGRSKLLAASLTQREREQSGPSATAPRRRGAAGGVVLHRGATCRGIGRRRAARAPRPTTSPRRWRRSAPSRAPGHADEPGDRPRLHAGRGAQPWPPGSPGRDDHAPQTAGWRRWPLPFLSRRGRAAGSARVVVVGGGFGGASPAPARCAPPAPASWTVTLWWRPDAGVPVACPFSNPVDGRAAGDGRRSAFTLHAGGWTGIRLVAGGAGRCHRPARRGQVTAGRAGRCCPTTAWCCRPGSRSRFDALPGYDAAAAER